MNRYRVKVTNDNLVFCAAHLITHGGECEMLHGHNYRLTAALEGDCDDSHYVFDFVTLKRMLKHLCDALDHRVLLATENEHLVIATQNDQVTMRFHDKRYVFPLEDVVLLPILNTTAEMLAAYLCQQLKEVIGRETLDRLTAIEVEVEESFGQAASYREMLA